MSVLTFPKRTFFPKNLFHRKESFLYFSCPSNQSNKRMEWQKKYMIYYISDYGQFFTWYNFCQDFLGTGTRYRQTVFCIVLLLVSSSRKNRDFFGNGRSRDDQLITEFYPFSTISGKNSIFPRHQQEYDAKNRRYLVSVPRNFWQKLYQFKTDLRGRGARLDQCHGLSWFELH